MVEPDVLSSDPACVIEFHDVEDPETEWSIQAWHTERRADCPNGPHALVGEAVVAVVAMERLDSFSCEIGEDLLVGRSSPVVPDGRTVSADDVVLDVGDRVASTLSTSSAISKAKWRSISLSIWAEVNDTVIGSRRRSARAGCHLGR